MLRSVFGKSLWDQRRGILIWSLGVAGVGVMYAAFYPTLNSPEMIEFMKAYPKEIMDAMGITDLATPEGYLGGTTYGILGPILMIIIAASLGTRAIAGEEEAGRLDVLLAHPISRWRVVIERAAAMLVALALAGLVLLLGMTAMAGVAEFESIGVANLAAASGQLVLLGLFFGSLALAVGALTGIRGLALGLVAIVGVLTYFANNLGPSVDWLAWSQDFSPFHYYSGGEPLRNGFQLIDSLVLLGASILLVALAVIGFERRDVAT
jgi:ABC-2 type transport system permease protein